LLYPSRMKAQHAKTITVSALAIVAMTIATGCGGAPSSGGSEGTSAAAPGSPAAAFEGDYQATWSATATISSPAGVPPQTGTLSAVIKVTALDDSDIMMAWQVQGNAPSGTITFAVAGNQLTPVGSATGGTCWTGVLPNGNTQTSCATSATTEIDGNTLVQHQSGTLTGTTPSNEPYSGTYVGTWTGVRGQ
jgi:hypothetical protein